MNGNFFCQVWLETIQTRNVAKSFLENKMPYLVKKQITAPQNVTCQNNVLQTMKFTTTAANGERQSYLLLAKDQVARTNGRGLYSGAIVPAFNYVGTDLIGACAAPTNTSVAINCGSATGTAICPALAGSCDFNSANFAPVGDPVAVGNGTVQLGRLINDVAGGSAFELCAKNKLSNVVAAELAASPIVSSSASKTAGSSKKLLVAVAVAAASMFVLQNA